jgi:hypothetical protein
MHCIIIGALHVRYRVRIQLQLEIINKFPIIVAVPKEPPVNGDNNRKVFNYLKLQLDSNPVSDMQCSNNYAMHASRLGRGEIKASSFPYCQAKANKPIVASLILWRMDVGVGSWINW